MVLAPSFLSWQLRYLLNQQSGRFQMEPAAFSILSIHVFPLYDNITPPGVLDFLRSGRCYHLFSALSPSQRLVAAECKAVDCHLHLIPIFILVPLQRAIDIKQAVDNEHEQLIRLIMAQMALTDKIGHHLVPLHGVDPVDNIVGQGGILKDGPVFWIVRHPLAGPQKALVLPQPRSIAAAGNVLQLLHPGLNAHIPGGCPGYHQRLVQQLIQHRVDILKMEIKGGPGDFSLTAERCHGDLLKGLLLQQLQQRVLYGVSGVNGPAVSLSRRGGLSLRYAALPFQGIA